MGFQPPVPQDDSDWEIRVAVQVSLVLQILLIFVGPMRKRSSSPVPRFTVWSCYLLADWVADLALGLLLNNMGTFGTSSSTTSSFSFGTNKRGGASSSKRGGGGGGTVGTTSSSSPMIFAFWTPFLLLHLGGPDTITAYSLEDNELWLRHLIGLLFELFSACVIFGSSVRGNPVIPATVLMFVAGIIKYGERTFSLRAGSVDGFRDNILDPPDPGPNYAKLMTEFDSKQKAKLVVEIAIADGEAKKAHEEMEEKETARLVRSGKSVEARAYDFFLTFRRLFVNLILSFKERRQSQAFFLHNKELTPEKAFEVIEVELNFIYDMVYTKAPVAMTWYGWVMRGICSACLVSSLVIFFFLDKAAHGIRRVDVGITYALLLGGLALDAAALLMLLLSDRATVYLEHRYPRRLAEALDGLKRRCRPRRWSGKTSQLNLIEHCRGPGRYSDRGAPWWVKAAHKLGAHDLVDDFHFIRRVKLQATSGGGPNTTSNDDHSLLGFIFGGLRNAATELQKQGEGKKKIMELCGCRGEGVLKEKIIVPVAEKDLEENGIVPAAKKEQNERFEVIWGSVVGRDFDESLLLWHIATDLCHDEKVQGPEVQEVAWRRPIAETLSEYMLYLLIKQPEMLEATAGIGLLRYRDTREEARRFFASMEPWIESHQDAREMLLKVNTSKKPAEVKGDRSKSVLFDAVILAKALQELEDEELRWEVVTGVWREMLTYAAGKCRGRTHVRQLSRGGELITLVWFLMAHMGLGDMYQIQEGYAKAKLIVKDQ